MLADPAYLPQYRFQVKILEACGRKKRLAFAFDNPQNEVTAVEIKQIVGKSRHGSDYGSPDRAIPSALELDSVALDGSSMN